MNTKNENPSPTERIPKIWTWLMPTMAGTILLHWWNFYVLNTDAIAYLRLAEYYSTGNFELAINGYWGPLLSWLMVPLLKLGAQPLIAARVIMAVSTLVFAVSANQLMSVFEITRRSHIRGMALSCSAAAIWGAQNITPDLLLAGLALLAISSTSLAIRANNLRMAGVAGLAWGAAYLAKAIALPWALLVIGCFGLIQWGRRQFSISTLAMIGGGIAILALPWIAVLSSHTGHLTFSTSGRIAHSLAGPMDQVRYHPTFVTFHEPREGRLTSWENPVELNYQHWSPIESKEYFAYQIRLVVENFLKVAFIITTIVPVWPLIALIWLRTRTSQDRVSTTLPAMLPLGLLCLIYLPVYLTINEQRYFYVALPILWVALSAVRSGSAIPDPIPVLKRGVLTFAFGVILCALIVSTIAYQLPARTAGSEARELAIWLESNNHSGSIAGSGMRPGGRSGLYTAWYLGEPWLGDSRASGARTFLESGAKLLVFSSNDPMIIELENSTDVHRLELPESISDKLVVFEVNQ